MATADPLLPTLLVAGVTKSGTTSLFAYLAQHPQICAASEKDINYFSPLRRGEPIEQPLSMHDRYFAHCRGEPHRLDASPDYFNGGPAVVHAVQEHYPKVKVVMILRDPVARLWSAFRYRKSIGRLDEATSFDAFLDACVESYRLGRHTTPEYEHHRTLPEARYAEHLAGWFDAFGDDVRIVFSEDVAARPAEIVADLCAWLGIEVGSAASIEYAPHNVTIAARSRLVEVLARQVNNRADALFRRLPHLEAGLRHLYLRLNAATDPERMSDAQRARVEDFYRDANIRLLEQLRERGYDRFPTWLIGTT